LAWLAFGELVAEALQDSLAAGGAACCLLPLMWPFRSSPAWEGWGVAAWRPLASGSLQGVGLAGLRGVGRWRPCRVRWPRAARRAACCRSRWRAKGGGGCCGLAAAGFWFFAGRGLGWPSGSWSLKALQGSLAAAARRA